MKRKAIKNNRRKKYRRTALKVFGLSFLLLIIGFAILQFRIYQDNNRPFSWNLSAGAVEIETNIEVSLVLEKAWSSDYRGDGYDTGAQYDGIIVNNTTKDIKEWELTIYLPQEGVIDSYWNGIYKEEKDTIVIKPLEYNNVIAKGEEQTFGFVMYSKDKLEFSDFAIKGYYQSEWYQYGMSYILIALSVTWFISLVIYLGIYFRIRKLERRNQKDQEIISQAMLTFAYLVDAKDEYTKEHSVRVAIYATEIGRRMGMSEEEILSLRYIALVHDCGKVGVPDAVLNKKGALDAKEREIINSHTILGGHVLEHFNAIEGIRDGALYHHERYDGHGYPDKLKGKEIPLCARIIGIADAYDAMSSDRCYRKHLSKEQIINELKGNSGTQFDPNLVPYMIAMIEDGFVEHVHSYKIENEKDSL